MDPERLKSFSLDAQHTSARAASLSNSMTLRNVNRDYRDAGGRCWKDSLMPELSGSEKQGLIPCLNKFDNTIGHVHDGTILCFPLKRSNTLLELVQSLGRDLEISLASGMYWCPRKLVRYTRSGISWSVDGVRVPEDDLSVLTYVSTLTAPISLSTVHAAMEAAWYPNRVNYHDVFKFPHNASQSTGLIGTLADNQCVDMLPGDRDKSVNVEDRLYLDEYLGFICAGHTSHSGEAGKIRRVTCDVRVRILNRDTITSLKSAAGAVSATGDCSWTVFCMGHYCVVCLDEVEKLLDYHRCTSVAGPTRYSLHINAIQRVLLISISSGVLTKRCSNTYWADNVEVHLNTRLSGSMRPTLNMDGPDQLRAYFSAFFSLHPYISSDRAPRPLMSSVQLPQAACLPWCPGTAAVSPCYSFDPLVTTPMYRAVMSCASTGEADVASTLPGENALVLYLNMPLTFEDAIMVSRRYVDNGGFSTISMALYDNLQKGEYVSPVGVPLCSKLSPWWKSPCPSHCKHTTEWLESASRIYGVGRTPTSRVVSRSDAPSGDISVKVRTYQQLQQGDKLSTVHGQKGVAVMINYEDMPVAYTSCGAIVPDVVVAMSSITTRQTNGQMYESAHALNVVRDGGPVPAVVHNGNRFTDFEDVSVRRGATGKLFMTAVRNDANATELALTKATIGMVRMFNQTQMSRERHHVSHLSMSKYTLRTPTGRAKGGAVAWGEMEVQAMSSQGSQYSEAELLERGDRIVVPACPTCKRLAVFCGLHTERIPVVLHYDLFVLDVTNYITSGGTFQYEFSLES